MTAAIDFLTKAADLMAERGKQYDQPAGERSMGKAVAAFNVITGQALSEAEGWLLLQILKDVRQWQRPHYHADSAEDCVAYAALKAEALAAADIERGYAELLDKSSALSASLKGVAESFLAERDDAGQSSTSGLQLTSGEWPDETRRQDAAAEDEAFAAVEASQPRIDSGLMWNEWNGGHQPVLNGVVVEAVLRNGSCVRRVAEAFSWRHRGADWEVVRWREPWPEDAYTGQGGVMLCLNHGRECVSCECRP